MFSCTFFPALFGSCYIHHVYFGVPFIDTFNTIVIYLKKKDIYCELKSYRHKLLGQLVVQHDTKVSFDGRSYV